MRSSVTVFFVRPCVKYCFGAFLTLKQAEAFHVSEISNVILTLLIQSAVLGPVMLTHVMVFKRYTDLSSTISGNLVDNIRRAFLACIGNRETRLTNSAVHLIYQSYLHI